MTLTLKFSKTPPKSVDAVVGLTDKNKKLPVALKELDKAVKGYISDALKNSASFEGKSKQVLTLALPKNDQAKHVVIIGLGDQKKLNTLDFENAGGKILTTLESLKVSSAAILSEGHETAHIAHGLELRSYKFDKYRPKKDKDKTPSKLTVTMVEEKSSSAKKDFDRLEAVASGVFLARDLVNEAPNALYPESYANIIKKELTPLGIKVEIFDHKKLEAMGAGAILAVGQGSARKPCMVVMRWNGSGKKMDKPLGLVGKGVTFDTGGISLKPGAGMDEMKLDMGGSAAVVGTMKALAAQKSKKDVVGIVGLAENMPSSNAYRPGDIVKSYSGKHVEVLNTDAEGRLVLADCMTYIQEKFDPSFIIDLATLTGAIIVSLASEFSGVFVNDDKLWNEINEAGASTGEKVWRMPLDDFYRKNVESDIGDVRNLAKNGRWGGACTAAAFIEAFVDDKRKWAHIDIAGTAMVGGSYGKSEFDLGPKGGTGVGVRLLEKLIFDHK